MREVQFTTAVREALGEELARSERVIILGTSVRTGTYNGGITAGLVSEFGEQRVIDTPVAEAALAGIAAGAAMAGFRPFVDVGTLGYALSLMDQVTNQAAKMHYVTNGQVTVPVVYWFEVCSPGWGVHHSQAIHALLCHLPGLKVLAPSTPSDAKGLLKQALRDENPIAVLVHPELYGAIDAVPDGEYLVEIGKAQVVRPGRDVTIIAGGWCVPRALEAATALAADGVSAEVVDLRSLVPLDWATMTASVAATGRAVIYDQGHRTGGIAATLAAGLQERVFHALKGPVGIVAAADVPVPFSPVLEDEVMPGVARLVEAVRRSLNA